MPWPVYRIPAPTGTLIADVDVYELPSIVTVSDTEKLASTEISTTPPLDPDRPNSTGTARALFEGMDSARIPLKVVTGNPYPKSPSYSTVLLDATLIPPSLYTPKPRAGPSDTVTPDGRPTTTVTVAVVEIAPGPSLVMVNSVGTETNAPAVSVVPSLSRRISRSPGSWPVQARSAFAGDAAASGAAAATAITGVAQAAACKTVRLVGVVGVGVGCIPVTVISFVDRALTLGGGHAETSTGWRKRDDLHHAEEELHRGVPA